MSTIFSKIINKEIPSHIIYENNDFLIILDIKPKNLGHCLIIAKEEKENIFLNSKVIQTEIIAIATKLSNAIIFALGASGIKIISNIGKSAGQEVFHTHFHVIPYYDSPKKIEVSSKVANLIKEHLK